MKHLMKLSIAAFAVAVLTFAFYSGGAYAQTVNHGIGFVDENGDGYNDNAPDSDGDGIPNGQDPDYVPVNPDQGKRFGFIDEDGDGINDRMQDADGDGIPNCQDPDYVKPQDGTGNKYGQKALNRLNGQKLGFRGSKLGVDGGTGVCDGTGPKGVQKQLKASGK